MNETPPVTAILRGVLVFVVASFLTQAVSHFFVNADHYAEVSYLRAEPIMALGIGAMLVQGVILAVVYLRSLVPGQPLVRTLRFAWLWGAFLVAYIALVEAGKYQVPSIGSWIAVELVASAVQFTLFGCLLHFAFRGWSTKQ